MIQCYKCCEIFHSDKTICAHCGFVPQQINNLTALASELAYAEDGFDPKTFALLAKLEADNFWFRARNKIILWGIEKYFLKFKSFMEIGCGTGFVLSAIAKQYPSASLIGSELFVNGLTNALCRVPTARCIQMDARQIPYIDEFDLIGAFDVLEHIKEDNIVLKNIFTALRPGGGLILTVPQHQWLWSHVDVMACHKRRYSAKEIALKLQSAGFEILRSTSFVSFLLPAMLLSRTRGQGGRQYDPLDEFKLNPFLNRMLEDVLNIERIFIQLGLNFPIGGSRLVMARKKLNKRILFVLIK